MEVSKKMEKLSKLRDAHGVFSKVRAVFSGRRTVADEAESSQNLAFTAPFEQVRAYELEAEQALAQAQKMAERTRLRIA